MAKIIELKTNYQPHKFDTQTVRKFAEYLHGNLNDIFDGLVSSGMNESDIQGLFTAALNESFTIRRESQKPIGKYQVGQLIYYRGDMANIAGWFRITKANPPSQYMGLSYDMKELDGDRTMVQIKESMISEVDKRNGLTRFVTEKAYNKAREEYNKAREEEENRINETKRQEKSKEFFIEEKGSHVFFSNKHCTVTYDSTKKTFYGTDVTDISNSTAFYNKTSRSHKKAAEALKALFDGETTMYGAMKVLRESGINCHSYCRMD